MSPDEAIPDPGAANGYTPRTYPVERMHRERKDLHDSSREQAEIQAPS